MVDNSWFEGKNSPGAGDLGQIQALQTNLANTADAAQHARSSLSGLKDQVSDAVWRGRPAEEFKDNISSDFLGQLDKLHTSYADAAAGFQTYIGAVSDIKTRANALAQKIYAAQTHYNTQASALHGWLVANPASGSYSHGDLTAPGFNQGAPYTVSYHTAPAPTGTKPGSAAADAAANHAASVQSNYSALQGNVNDAYSALQSLYRQMDTLKTHDRVAADNAVVAKVDHAGSEGLRNESGWHKFFHALSTVAKWVAVALVVIAVVAVVVLMTGGAGLGLLAALAEVASTSTALGSLVVYGSAAASATMLVGDLGQRATGDGPGWGKIALDAFGMIPGLGKAADLIGDLGGPVGRAAIALHDGAVLTRLRSVYGIEGLVSKIQYTNFGLKFAGAMDKLEGASGPLKNYILGLGENRPPNGNVGAALWGILKANGLWSGAALVFPGIGLSAVLGHAKAGARSLTHDVHSGAAQQQIAQFQKSNPTGAARAHQIAQNLAKGAKANFSYPKQLHYPQSVPVHP